MSGGTYLLSGMNEMIAELHACLKEQYQPGAFKWIDENFENAWSLAVSRFESAMALAIKTQDRELFVMELGFYKSKTMDMFNRYKKLNNKADIETYLQNIKDETLTSLTVP